MAHSLDYRLSCWSFHVNKSVLVDKNGKLTNINFLGQMGQTDCLLLEKRTQKLMLISKQ